MTFKMVLGCKLSKTNWMGVIFNGYPDEHKKQ